MSARRTAVPLIVSLLFPLALCSAQTLPKPATAQAGSSMGLQSDEESSAVEDHWSHNVRNLLIEEKFDELDSIADRFRNEKTRASGGGWRIREFYEVLDVPYKTDKDFVDHLEHLRKWMQQRPESITARVALATSLTRWAWVARGNGLADTVTDEGWRLFGERANEALTVLQGSRDMRAKCPQWYSEMMIVGLALGWNGSQMRDIYDRAVQFEPDYEYFYKARTNYLLPKWYGKEDDATAFAKSAADKLGGDAGEIMYYRMATCILKRGNGNIDRFLQQMDWPRIQRGYTLLNAQFGHDGRSDNAFAFMAYRYKDAPTAQRQFALIGDKWSVHVWRDRNSFERARDWSTGHESWP